MEVKMVAPSMPFRSNFRGIFVHKSLVNKPTSSQPLVTLFCQRCFRSTTPLHVTFGASLLAAHQMRIATRAYSAAPRSATSRLAAKLFQIPANQVNSVWKTAMRVCSALSRHSVTITTAVLLTDALVMALVTSPRVPAYQERFATKGLSCAKPPATEPVPPIQPMQRLPARPKAIVASAPLPVGGG